MTLHTLISYVKSAIRILGYAMLPINSTVGVATLIVAELIGIYEEMVV